MESLNVEYHLPGHYIDDIYKRQPTFPKHYNFFRERDHDITSESLRPVKFNGVTIMLGLKVLTPKTKAYTYLFA